MFPKNQGPFHRNRRLRCCELSAGPAPNSQFIIPVVLILAYISWVEEKATWFPVFLFHLTIDLSFHRFSMYTTPPWLGAAQHHHLMPREQNALARHRTRSAKSIHNHLINNPHTIHHFLITWTRWCDDIFSGEGLHFTCRWRRQFSLILRISTALNDMNCEKSFQTVQYLHQLPI